MNVRAMCMVSVAVAAVLATGVAAAQRTRVIPYEHTDFRFHDINTFVTNSVDKCVSECLANDKCVAFSYFSGGMCHLKDAVGFMTSDSMVTSGFIASRGMPPKPIEEAPKPAPPPAKANVQSGGGMPPPGAIPATGSLRWVAVGSGGSLPGDAVAGGNEDGRPLAVCRAAYAGGIHPGKVVNGNCNIAYGGKEVVLHEYQVLAGADYHWGPPQPGLDGAFVAGGENGERLYLCQAEYRGNMHPGKVVKDDCDISYGGAEVPVRDFRVLYSGH